ncbi:hypothetical protein MNB_SV-9-924 [hydrothermal vent metagenome]|uniref:DUF2249 domain-containing protein n=1 Tax=hydrothermal vent metagenome TaxID=652676 RepID=A0A1W1CA57_9ZZZZ
MNIISKPDNSEQFSPEGATVPFFKYEMGESQIIEFDTSKCGPPEPMVNAMIGLKMVDENTSLLMINHKTPAGLINKIGENYIVDSVDTPDGGVQLLFSYKSGESEKANLSDNKCHG